MENKGEAEQGRGMGSGGDPLSPRQPRAKLKWAGLGLGVSHRPWVAPDI